VKGVIHEQAVIDEKIIRYTANYELKRISAVDRNILRMAIYEMLFCNDVPPIVAINEAIDIAKKFGTEESGKFVNGVLDRVKLDLNRPLRTAIGFDS
ncbi:MAG: transcription antitermination factor NusB, partial [Verrucomicrobia bacterium]|nr:transcription antitermination factor NusB [Verrucomicrobiota bacterium]